MSLRGIWVFSSLEKAAECVIFSRQPKLCFDKSIIVLVLLTQRPALRTAQKKYRLRKKTPLKRTLLALFVTGFPSFSPGVDDIMMKTGNKHINFKTA